MSFIEKLAPVKGRHDELSHLLSSGDLSSENITAYSKEYADLTPIVETINAYEQAVQERADLQEMIEDPEMAAMAKDELRAIEEKIPLLEQKVQMALIPKDMADEKNAILEIRAGTGGDEAALFVGDLYAMYRGYASGKGWKLERMEESLSEVGGYKEVICTISGTNVFAAMKFESGVHRVQRIPKTESGGRIHTSAATVAVLPEAQDVDIEINDSDLRIDTFRSQGAGGQHVNTTDSAVRITHIPTGIAVAIQEEKSQHKNKARAMSLLRAKLYDIERQRVDDERAADRKDQIGSGDRSERIRTYNYPQGRCTDHRVNVTLYKLEEVLSGGDGLQELIDALHADDQARKLSQVT